MYLVAILYLVYGVQYLVGAARPHGVPCLIGAGMPRSVRVP
jgi:hypothetical protein